MVGVSLLAVAVISLIGFPAGSWALGLGLALYAAVLLRFPRAAYLIAIPLLLPVFDLAPLSGRFFWDEFDILIATTLGMRLLTMPPMQLWRETGVPVPRVALWLLFASVAASAAIAIWPPAPLDANAFSSYLSTYNALRVAKGYGWAGAMIWLVWRDAAEGGKVVPPLRLGLALGLLTATLSVFWERLLFVGSTDFGAVFRASGLVSATHVGGAYLEAILVLLAPFGLATAVAAKRWPSRLMWYVVVLLGACAVLLTLSRAAVFAWLISVAVFALVWWSKSKPGRRSLPHAATAMGGRRRHSWLARLAVLAAHLSQLGERLAASRSDLSVRVAHWKRTIELIRADPVHVFLGSGLGSFPREFYLAYAGTQQLPGYRLERDPGSVGNYMVLTGGHGMYVDQRVAARPGSELHLRRTDPFAADGRQPIDQPVPKSRT